MRRWWWLFMVAFWSWHCAALSQPAVPYEPLTFVRQTGETDCGIAAIAMAARTSWELVEEARLDLGIDRDNGMYESDIVRLATYLGVVLEKRPRINPLTEEGIVVVKGWRTHAIYVYRNYVYDPLSPGPEPYVIAISKWEQVLYVLVKVDMSERNPRFTALLREIQQIHDAKSSDYATDTDPLHNLRRSASFGVPPWKGTLVRMSDKWGRIEQLAGGKTPKNESLRDTLVDMAVYSLLAVLLLDEAS
jgi:hypothetical protein